MLREIAYSFAGLVLLAYAAEWALTLFDDPREPQRIQPHIPLIGHLLGMIQKGMAYYGDTSKKTKAEIYTLSILRTKLYVVKTRRLTPMIQKSSKTLSFRPFMQTAAKIMGDVTNETYEIFGTDVVDDLSHGVKIALGPGQFLDKQNLRMGKRVMHDIDELVRSGTNKVFLLEWTRHAVVQASSCGVWGEVHPFRDPKVEAAFWEWQVYLPSHMVGLDLTRKGYAAREIVFQAFREYCNNVPDDSSEIFLSRTRIMREAGVCEEDICKQQATFGTAAFANTAPALYWATYELFSRLEVLEEVRTQLVEHAVSGSKESGFRLNVSALKTKCPLLLSVFQETQRTRHIHANIRKVTADTLLDGKYLLKAGNFVQMPGNPIHTNPEIWGDTVDVFDPYRFVPRDDRKPISPSSFFAWGAPPHLCPARQFAATEILIVVASLAMRVDMVPAGTGRWERNPAVNVGDMVTMYNPKKDVQVEVKEREAWAGDWALEMGDSKTRVSLASG
ncbi:cytochrome P450 [Dactylonectria macrodidyma]|uniref:Cytochrome P450 n=1 Tax=Dactylonectria macrodidyma TaxID=307937 RepID=A0A9P9E4Y3_9HYPO|nr:cytochrome P450 [Dactylonectria macrodidyma]